MFDSTSIFKSVLLVLLCGGVHQAYTADSCAKGSRQPLMSEVALPFKDAVGDSCPEEPKQNSIAAEYQSERIKASFPIEEEHWQSYPTSHGEAYESYTDEEPLPPPKSPERPKSLRQKIRSILPRMDGERLTAALSHMTWKEVKPGDVIFKQGDRGDVFYVVEVGEFDAYHKEHDSEKAMGEKTGTYDADRPYIYIDQFARLYSDKLLITVKARTDGILWQIDRWLYTRTVVEEYKRVRHCDAIDLKKFSKGDVMMKECYEAHKKFFIDEGEPELMTQSGVAKVPKKGDHFGELASLKRQPRDALEDYDEEFFYAQAGKGKHRVVSWRKPALGRARKGRARHRKF